MEIKNRNWWIVVIIVAVAATLCCCVVIAGTTVGSWLLDFPIDSGWGSGVEGGKVDRTFDVGEAPHLYIDNFAGSIVVRAGDGGECRILATRHAPRSSDLDSVEIDIEPRAGQLAITTKNPDRLRNAWVRLEVLVPAGTSFDLSTSSGTVEIAGLRGGGNAETSSGRVTARDLAGNVSLHTSSGGMSVRAFEGTLKLHVSSGDIDVLGVDGVLDAHTSSGTINVRDAQGTVRLDTSSGSIDYRGSPVGECSFATGSGSIDLRLPADLNAKVDLQTGSGTVRLSFPVEGEQTRQSVRGIIGSGNEATIYARTSSGSIRLTGE